MDAFVKAAGKFQEPGAFARLLEGARGGLTKEELYSKAGRQELKDAWQAAMFALGYQDWRHVLTEVRICAQVLFPDFEVRIEGSVFEFECVALYEAGRRMGDDYRGDTTLGAANRPKPASLPALNLDDVREVIAKKAMKNYDSEPNLTVYLNVKAGNVNFADLTTVALDPSGERFPSIWFITDHHIGCGKSDSRLPSPSGWIRVPIA